MASASSSSSDNPHGVYVPANKNFPFLYTKIRDKVRLPAIIPSLSSTTYTHTHISTYIQTTSNTDFARYASRIMTVLGEEALGVLAYGGERGDDSHTIAI